MTAPDSAQPLLAHLTELRDRLLICVAVLLVTFGLCWLLAPQIFALLVQPLADTLPGSARRLIYTGLTEAFMTYTQVALWAACFLCLPLFLAQGWRFVVPGLYRHERAALRPFLVAAPLLFYGGAALAYFFIFPLAWKFFLSFEGAGLPGSLPIALEARMSEYLALSMSLIMAFGLAFQFPLVLLLLVRAGVLSAAQLIRARRFAIVGIFAAAAVLTPPDVLSQILLALPLLALYELTVLLARRMPPPSQHDGGTP